MLYKALKKSARNKVDFPSFRISLVPNIFIPKTICCSVFCAVWLNFWIEPIFKENIEVKENDNCVATIKCTFIVT